jgi:hypothetical protein
MTSNTPSTAKEANTGPQTRRTADSPLENPARRRRGREASGAALLATAAGLSLLKRKD